jgi:hypothetical protein
LQAAFTVAIVFRITLTRVVQLHTSRECAILENSLIPAKPVLDSGKLRFFECRRYRASPEPQRQGSIKALRLLGGARKWSRVPDPEAGPTFEEYRATLASIFQDRPGYEHGAPGTWDQATFLRHLRKVFEGEKWDNRPAGFDYFASDRDNTQCRVVLVWRGEPADAFAGRNANADLAFLEAAAKAYEHPRYRKFLEWPMRQAQPES